ncbi:MAG: nicotinate-nucleotide adenylyltransferase [Oculatellaceae cyanobacterium Prado106]|jgi:nicotinate-nucleotide adenylyltransferase|nr:nicotinate-nucleotide adenylyltransferase [Oculatellaceae cyanobacterium Prado106]
MPTLALFGTSADPPTAGHLAILSWLSRHFDEVAVWASDNPFKLHQTPLEHRQRMLQLLIEEIHDLLLHQGQPPNVQLYPELSYPRAFMTVERARLRWPDGEFTLVIGSDLVSQLPQWYKVEDLLQAVKLLVVPRPGYPIAEWDLRSLRHLGAEVAIADLSAPAVSSSTYREQGDSEIIPPPVEAYITQERLYHPPSQAYYSAHG